MVPTTKHQWSIPFLTCSGHFLTSRPVYLIAYWAPPLGHSTDSSQCPSLGWCIPTPSTDTGTLALPQASSPTLTGTSLALLSANIFHKLPLKPMSNVLISFHLSATALVRGHQFFLLGHRVIVRIESCLHEALSHQSLRLPGWDSAKLPVWALCSELWEGLW